VTNARFFKPITVLALLFSIALPISAQANEIGNIADTLSRALSKPPRRTVAVVDFTDLQGNVTALGQFMAEELESALANSGGGIDLVDRTRLQLLMQENKLASTGIIDPATARKLGKIAGVQILITGTLTPLTDTVRFSVKALDTEDARIVASTSRDILKTRDVMQLLGQSTMVRANPPGELPPVPSAGVYGTSTNPSAPRPQVVEEQSVSFALKSCILSGASVTCTLTITNKGDDRDMAINGQWMGHPSRMIDGNGRESALSHESLGSKEGDGGGIKGTLVSAVPTRAELRFDKVPSDIASIARLDVAGTINNKDFEVQFRKVSISVNKY
jgi:TolB-like protein